MGRAKGNSNKRRSLPNHVYEQADAELSGRGSSVIRKAVLQAGTDNQPYDEGADN